ncbi:LOW QUALITY PROTEIN: uncharacterized protein LOC124272919 [Haliotis rubra]|uniref:LOW QUALITY PROTEIN: uncharacterized protein LOC124272919 n=1 Tax=Haliotis rubra TaxID=36100 RepID=UPI001EE500FA|nr:LOW QUALITY PROTEIN: uncharacterized protein LOC124272919 [Haliotis rubra]
MAKLLSEMDGLTRTMGSKDRHASRVQDLLYQQMLEHSTFCDVTLVIGEVEIKAHWCILVSCPFFQSLYDSGMREKTASTPNIWKRAWAMKEAVKFLYVGTVEVNMDAVKELLEAAEYLQIGEMKKCCSDYLFLIDINVDNCVNLSLMASLYDLELYNRAFQFLRGHLPEVMGKDDILVLTKESIVFLLTDETLSYVSQEEFFDFIFRWTVHELDEREDSFPELFACLDLTKMSKSFLEDTVEHCPLVVKFEKCKVHLLNVKVKQMFGMLTHSIEQKNVILICGGSGPGVYIGHFMLPYSDFMSVNNMFAYVIDEKRWTELAPLPYAMRRPMLVCDESGNLYVYDNSNGLEEFYLFQYRVSDKTWTSIKVVFPSNCENVTIQNMVCCANRIFFIASGILKKNQASNGGAAAAAAHASQNTAWTCFLMEVNQNAEESTIKCKLFPRNPNTEINVCAVNNTYVCVAGWKCGDKGGKKSRHSAKFVYFDTKSDRRYDASRGCIFENYMFPYSDGIMVGKPGEDVYPCVLIPGQKVEAEERLWNSPSSRKWRSCGFLVHMCKDEFYVFGGKSLETKEPLKSVFKYNLEKKQWIKVEDMPEALMGSAVCVGKMPRDHVRCHIQCPHCQYVTRRSQATYDIAYSDNPDDDDDEYSIDNYSYDYSNHSYVWDEDDMIDLDDDDIYDEDYDYWAT